MKGLFTAVTDLKVASLAREKNDLMLATVTKSMGKQLFMMPWQYFPYTDQLGTTHLFNRQGDVFQYAVLYFELIHHCSLQQTVSWLLDHGAVFLLMLMPPARATKLTLTRFPKQENTNHFGFDCYFCTLTVTAPLMPDHRCTRNMSGKTWENPVSPALGNHWLAFSRQPHRLDLAGSAFH